MTKYGKKIRNFGRRFSYNDLMNANQAWFVPEALLNTFWLRLLALASLLVALTYSAQAASITFKVLETFDYPGAKSTWPAGINDANDVAGQFSPGTVHYGGFIRFHDGSFSDPIYDPNDTRQATYLTGINNFGDTCGNYAGGGLVEFAFVRSADGTFTPFSAGPLNTYMGGINDAGNLCGETNGQGWVSIDGTVTTFLVPRSRHTDANGMNNLNQCIGSYDVISGYHGFLRNADGTLVDHIDASDAITTFLYGINDRGQMVGIKTDATGTHGVLFAARTNASFDYPGATFTRFDGINSHRIIVGDYIDADGFQHGFLVQAKVTQTE